MRTLFPLSSHARLERVYFRIPSHVLLLSAKTKDDLLWGVDRQTPGVAVQEFLLRAGNQPRRCNAATDVRRVPLHTSSCEQAIYTSRWCGST